MRRRTTQLHAAAERSGIVAALLKGQVSRGRYALYLRNLLPAYQAMERALWQRRDQSELAGLVQASLFRASSIVADLEELSGHGWVASLPMLAAGEKYAARVERAGRGELLIAHCYTRYLGDLNGGQLLRQRLTHIFGADFRALAFNGFPEIHDLAVFRGRYRAYLDQAGGRLADDTAVVEEAAVAFEMNIRLSVEVNAFQWPAPV